MRQIMSETKQYTYIIQPTRPAMLVEGLTPQEAEIRAQHFAYPQHLTAQGVMILVGRTLTTDQDTFGIAIFKANSDEEALAVMNNDPAVSRGLMHAKVFPFRVVLP